MFSYDNKLRFEGEYLYGKRNGEGKEYNTDGNLIFEGKYMNGEKSGKCFEYDNNGKLKFDGEYLYNYKIRGKEFIGGILEYEGEYLLGKKWNGRGYDENGDIIYELKDGNGIIKE